MLFFLSVSYKVESNLDAGTASLIWYECSDSPGTFVFKDVPLKVVLQITAKLRKLEQAQPEVTFSAPGVESVIFPATEAVFIQRIVPAVPYRGIWGVPVFADFGDGPQWSMILVAAELRICSSTTDRERRLGINDKIEDSFLLEEFRLDVDCILDDSEDGDDDSEWEDEK